MKIQVLLDFMWKIPEEDEKEVRGKYPEVTEAEYKEHFASFLGDTDVPAEINSVQVIMIEEESSE